MTPATNGMQIPPLTNRTMFSVREHNKRWKIVQGILNAHVRRGSKDQVHISDGNWVLELTTQDFASAAAAATAWHPFRIYNVPAPVGSGAAGWQCWQVHGGHVAQRSKSFLSTQDLQSNGEYYITGNGAQNGGMGTDSRIETFANQAFDFYAEGNDPVIAPVEIVNVSRGSSWTVSDPANAGLFILDDDPDPTYGDIRVAVWLDVDPDALVYRVYFGFVDLSAFPVTVFPTGQNIIPIGYITSNPTGELLIPPDDYTDLVVKEQYLHNHLLSRYCPAVSGAENFAGSTGPAMIRGIWADPDTYGMAGQVYYDGDIVIAPSLAYNLDAPNTDAETITFDLIPYVHYGIGIENINPRDDSFGSSPGWYPLVWKA